MADEARVKDISLQHYGCEVPEDRRIDMTASENGQDVTVNEASTSGVE